MVTVKDLIDDIQERLHDNGSIFTRAEILNWIDEGYRRVTNEVRHAKTMTALDIPPRHHTAYTQPWEQQHVEGSHRKWTFTHQNGQRECTSLWEAQQEDGVTPSTQLRSVSHLWEISHNPSTGEADAQYRFFLPKNEDVPITVWYDHKRLVPLTSRALDTLEDKWWSVDGEPINYSQGLGNTTDFDIFEIESTYGQAYEHRNGPFGLPRGFDGDRTYTVDSDQETWDFGYAWFGEPQAADAGALTGIGRSFTIGATDDGFHYTFSWEKQQHDGETVTAATEGTVTTTPFTFDVSTDAQAESLTGDLEVGLFRKATSTQRQYFPSFQWFVFGIARKWNSSEPNHLLVWHSVNSNEVLSEDDDLDMLPEQLKKYLIYYALSILLNRMGEGYDAALAGHYQLRARRLWFIMRKLANVGRLSENYIRSGLRDRPRTRTALPQLPGNYPRAPWLS